MRNVPPDPDESVSEHVEHFFCVNHADTYLMHQVRVQFATIFDKLWEWAHTHTHISSFCSPNLGQEDWLMMRNEPKGESSGTFKTQTCSN